MSNKKKVLFKHAVTPVLSTVGARRLNENFFNAVYSRNIPEITKCLEKGVNPNRNHREHGVTPLHLLAERNDYILAYRLITGCEKVDIDIKTYHGYTPLHLATSYSYVKFVHMLLQNGANPDIPDRHGKTALHWAVERECVEIVTKLLKNGATINVMDSFENTPLSTSILNVKNLKIARMLLKDDIDPQFENSRSLHLFFEAVLECHTIEQLEFIDLLLRRGVDINLIDPNSGRNCLHFVAISGYVELAVVLVEQGAENTIDFSKRTPTKIAMDHDNQDMAEYLRTKCKPPNIMSLMPLLLSWSKRAKARVSRNKQEKSSSEVAEKSKHK